MASAPEPFDPMEKAFHALAKADLQAGETLPGAGRQLVRSYPLSPELLAMSQVWDGGAAAGRSPPRARPRRWPTLCRLDAAAARQR